MKLHKARILFLATAAVLPVFGQYGGFGGPSILSRGTGGSGRTGANPVGFSVFAGASGTYTTNLSTLTRSSNASPLTTRDLFGLNGSAGIQGYKSDERSSTSVDANIIYSWVKARDVSRGLSESLAFSHSRQLTRRVMWYFGANGQSTNRSLQFANARYSPEPLPDLSTAQEEIFDTRNTRANIGTGFSFQKSARLSFSAQGGAFGNERRSKYLVDSRGFMGSGSVQYSLTRRQSIGASFAYGTFYFPGTYGESRYYSPQAFYNVDLNRVWSFSVSAGFFRAHIDRLTVVQLDPFIAELTGQRTVLEIYNGDTTGFSGGASLRGNYHRWGISMTASRGLAPGNGIYMTSERSSLVLGVNHTLGRKATFSAYAGASQMKALSQTLGNARFYYAGTSFGYRLNSYLNFSSSLGVYRTQAAGQLIKLDRLTASAGIYFSPGELPLHLF